jgi:hypothetical protein
MHQQHTETFAVVPVKMFMMHFMRPADGPHIVAVAFGKPFKPLVNDHIMNQKITEAIRHNAKANGLHPPHMIKGAGINQQYAGYSEDDKERIILFEKARLHLMMIFVQVPEKTMHDIAVRKPGNAFHDDESKDDRQYI